MQCWNVLRVLKQISRCLKLDIAAIIIVSCKLGYCLLCCKCKGILAIECHNEWERYP